MSRYEFSLLQEVLMEKGAGVLGDLSSYKHRNGIVDRDDPVSVLYSIVWNAKQDILSARSEKELDQIEGQFNLANQFLMRVGGIVDG